MASRKTCICPYSEIHRLPTRNQVPNRNIAFISNIQNYAYAVKLITLKAVLIKNSLLILFSSGN